MAQIVNRGTGRWLVRVFLGRDEAGKRRYHNHTVRGTKKDAARYARRIQTEVDTGEFFEKPKNSAETVSVFLERWLRHTAGRKVSQYTLEDYRRQVARYINPVLGDVLLHKLAPADVERLVASMEERGLAPRTIRYAQGVLRNALNKAVREGAIATNPASANLIDLPKGRKRTLTVWSAAEARRFIEAASTSRWAALWIVLLGSGARPGEVLGLTWDDFDGKSIRIRRALVRDRRGGGWHLKEPKTKQSRRTVPLPSTAAAALRAHRVTQAAEKLAATEYADHGLIFADEHGEPPVWDYLGRLDFPDIVTQAGLPRIRPYDLRHTCASLLLAGGVNPKIVSERLGHSTIMLTLDTYSAVLPGLQEEATERLNELLGG